MKEFRPSIDIKSYGAFFAESDNNAVNDKSVRALEEFSHKKRTKPEDLRRDEKKLKEQGYKMNAGQYSTMYSKDPRKQ